MVVLKESDEGLMCICKCNKSFYWQVWGNFFSSCHCGSQNFCLVQACTPRTYGCISCFWSRSSIEEIESEGNILDFSTRRARKTGLKGGKLDGSCRPWDEATAVTGAGTGTEVDKLSLRWSRLLNWHLDNLLMFSGRTALDLKDPRVVEVPVPVVFRMEREVLMIPGSIRVVSQWRGFISAKVFNKSEVLEKQQRESFTEIRQEKYLQYLCCHNSYIQESNMCFVNTFYCLSSPTTVITKLPYLIFFYQQWSKLCEICK